MSIASAAAAWARGDWPGAARICEDHLRTGPNDADALLLIQAVGRWRRYRSQLQPILPGRDPLAIKLGYTAHND